MNEQTLNVNCPFCGESLLYHELMNGIGGIPAILCTAAPRDKIHMVNTSKAKAQIMKAYRFTPEGRAESIIHCLYDDGVFPLPSGLGELKHSIAAEIRAAVEAEREACARIAESPITGQPHTEFMRGKMEAANRIAQSIRARK